MADLESEVFTHFCGAKFTPICTKTTLTYTCRKNCTLWKEMQDRSHFPCDKFPSSCPPSCYCGWDKLVYSFITMVAICTTAVCVGVTTHKSNFFNWFLTILIKKIDAPLTVFVAWSYELVTFMKNNWVKTTTLKWCHVIEF